MFMVAKAEDGRFISPFLMHKVLKQTAGEMEKVNQIRDFKYLIKTKSTAQVDKLLKLNSIGDRKLILEPHPFLNTCRGVVRCNAFNYIEDEIILKELEDQKVTSIERILMRGQQSKDEKDTKKEFKNTGLFIISFNLCELPKKLTVGHELINIKQYYPRPMQCKQCHRFGHKQAKCDKEPVCSNCSSTSHTDNCSSPPACLNCEKSDHTPTSKNCTKYKEEVAIIKIQTDDKISMNMARAKFNELNKITKQTPTPIANIITNNNNENNFEKKLEELEKKMEQRLDNMMNKMIKMIEAQNDKIINLMEKLITHQEPPITQIIDETRNLGASGSKMKSQTEREEHRRIKKRKTKELRRQNINTINKQKSEIVRNSAMEIKIATTTDTFSEEDNMDEDDFRGFEEVENNIETM